MNEKVDNNNNKNKNANETEKRKFFMISYILYITEKIKYIVKKNSL